MQDGTATRRRELEDNRLFVRGVIAPQVGIVGPTSAVRVHQFREGLIDLNVATTEDSIAQLCADRDQQMRGGLDIPAAGLAADPDTPAGIDALLAIQR
jgi:hypothetical protein